MATITDGTILKTHSSVLSQTLEGEVVLLNLTTRKYYGLVNVGRFIWELLESQELSCAAIRCAVEEHYRCSTPQKVQQDVDSFLSHLLKNKLISEC